MKCMVINQFADNKGDRAVLWTLLQTLDRKGVREVVVSTTVPESWIAEVDGIFDMNVKFIPWGWGHRRLFGLMKVPFKGRIGYRLLRNIILSKWPISLCRLYVGEDFWKQAKEADFIVSTGGHHFTNWFAKEGYSPLFADLAVAEILNEKVLLWSQSIGPLEFSCARNQLMINTLMHNARAVFIRDSESEEDLLRIGVRKEKIKTTLESVFNIQCDVSEEKENRVGIAIYTGPVREAISRDHYIQIMANLVRHITLTGMDVAFFPMQIKNRSGDDRPLINAIIECSGIHSGITIFDQDLATFDHLREVGKCRFFVGHKTHSVVFALRLSIPLLAISYHPKTNYFMNMYGLDEYCIDESMLTSASVYNMFDLLVENEFDVTLRIGAKTGGFQRRVDDDLSMLLSLAQ